MTRDTDFGGNGPPAEGIRSIAVIRALALGDMLCAIPSLRALRSRYPTAGITLIGLPWARDLVERYPKYLDEHLAFPGYPGIPEVPVDPGTVLAFLADMQRRRFDLVVQLHGSGLHINEFALLCDGATTAGFVPPGLSAPGPGVWVPYPPHGSEVDRLLALPAALGAPVDPALEFPIADSDVDDLDRLLAGAISPKEPLAVVHAGGSTPSRRWPAERFAAVADELARAGLQVVLTGTAGERATALAVTGAMTARPVDLTGRTSLAAAAALIERARIVVTNDTGISHLAAAVGTQSVVIFSASDRDRWAPLDGATHVAIGIWPGGPGCRHPQDGIHRCIGDACSLDVRRDGPTPQTDVPVEHVLEAIGRLLGHGDPRAPATGARSG